MDFGPLYSQPSFVSVIVGGVSEAVEQDASSNDERTIKTTVRLTVSFFIFITFPLFQTRRMRTCFNDQDFFSDSIKFCSGEGVAQEHSKF